MLIAFCDAMDACRQLLVISNRTIAEMWGLVVAAVLPGNGHIVGVVFAQPRELVLGFGSGGEDGQIVVATMLRPIYGFLAPVAEEVTLEVGVVLRTVDVVGTITIIVERAGAVP